jgi:hypothetical protein
MMLTNNKIFLERMELEHGNLNIKKMLNDLLEPILLLGPLNTFIKDSQKNKHLLLLKCVCLIVKEIYLGMLIFMIWQLMAYNLMFPKD